MRTFRHSRAAGQSFLADYTIRLTLVLLLAAPALNALAQGQRRRQIRVPQVRVPQFGKGFPFGKNSPFGKNFPFGNGNSPFGKNFPFGNSNSPFGKSSPANKAFADFEKQFNQLFGQQRVSKLSKQQQVADERRLSRVRISIAEERKVGENSA